MEEKLQLKINMNINLDVIKRIKNIHEILHSLLLLQE